MIIDQLPEISSVQTTDEMPIERGQTTYKTPVSKIFASPTLTGTPKAPTANVSTDNTQIATTAFANRAANNAVSTFVRPNLLDNWYFVKGGGTTGDYGVFPINQRGQPNYSTSGYTIDRWRIDSNSSLTVPSDCITFSSGQVTGYQSIRQWFSQDLPAGTYTLSLLAEITSIGGTVFFGLRDSGNIIKNNIRLSSGSGYRLFTLTFTLDSTAHGWSTSIVTDNASSNYVTANIKAWKLENGSTQTLAHQENGAWVLNELPDYETELLRCKTSTAVPSDTYANGSVEFGNNIGIVQNTNTATQNISKGQYVIWHGALYTASAAISSGNTLSNSNLTAAQNGGLNDLKNNFGIKSISELGLTTPTKIRNIVNALPYGGSFVISIGTGQVTDADYTGELYIRTPASSNVIHKTDLVLRVNTGGTTSLSNNYLLGMLPGSGDTKWYVPALTER